MSSKKIILKQTFHCNYSKTLILKLQQSTHQTQQDFILYY